MKTQKQKGFTLIELLVVVAIIGVLATIVLSSLSDARARARDARRISEMKSFETALEMYYLDYNQYPPMTFTINSNADYSDADYSDFETFMAPYITIDFRGKYYTGEYGPIFHYKSKPSQNYQNYGMYVTLEVSPLGEIDGGNWNSAYELGPNPKYCEGNYEYPYNFWWWGDDRCG
jgi:prepilin-type N-terminal cleavage/methylation domain-containing protein